MRCDLRDLGGGDRDEDDDEEEDSLRADRLFLFFLLRPEIEDSNPPISIIIFCHFELKSKCSYALYIKTTLLENNIYIKLIMNSVKYNTSSALGNGHNFSVLSFNTMHTLICLIL